MYRHGQPGPAMQHACYLYVSLAISVEHLRLNGLLAQLPHGGATGAAQVQPLVERRHLLRQKEGGQTERVLVRNIKKITQHATPRPRREHVKLRYSASSTGSYTDICHHSYSDASALTRRSSGSEMSIWKRSSCAKGLVSGNSKNCVLPNLSRNKQQRALNEGMLGRCRCRQRKLQRPALRRHQRDSYSTSTGHLVTC
jgi:hypothetical protein